jgi:hypothetical protein
VTIDEPKPSENTPEQSSFFQKVDWLCFGVTTLLAFAIYLLTLAPDINLEYSGVYSTAAMYPSPSIPPGHPIWAIYGWIFIKLIPFSNIAWRLNIASAAAGALTCGLIALMVSRVGCLVVENILNFKNLSSQEQKCARLVCGSVAGLGFGLDGCFWCKAVIADTWPLSLFLFALTICLLARWFFERYRNRYLFTAALVLGLTLSESQALIPAAFALPFLLAFGNRKLGREMFFGISVFLWSILLMKDFMQHFEWFIGTSSQNVLIGTAVVSTVAWGSLSFLTRSFFSEWKITSLCAFLFFAGVGFDFLLPVFSMTTPPINWGYPRTVEGFFHVLSRGQFSSVNPTNSFSELLSEWNYYGKVAMDEFGLIYLIAAAIPFFLLQRFSSLVRRWLGGLLAVWFFISLLMLLVLNLNTSDRSDLEYVKSYFAATHIVLALFSGYGLMLVVAIFGRPR